MGTGTKLLAGCGCLALAIATALVAGLGLGLFWLKGRAQDLTAGIDCLTAATDEIDTWEARANSHRWERPSDGVVPEPRLLTFLEVRRRVHAVYETHKADIEALARGEGGAEPLDPARVIAMGGRTAVMFTDLRLAQVRALAELGMSEPEYRAIQFAVYKAAGAARTRAETGHMPAEAVSAGARQVEEAVRTGLAGAREAGVPGSDRVGEDDVRRIEEKVASLGASGAEALAVPPQNLALIEKHRADIERYAMHGLAFLGL